MSKEKKKNNNLKWILVAAAIVVVLTVVIIRLLTPKVDYVAMGTEIRQYTDQLENIKDIEANGDKIFKITLESDSWYAGTEKDKMVYCKNVNQTLTVICQKYKTVNERQRADVYYYDEDGILIAEPSDKGYTLESKILH